MQNVSRVSVLAVGGLDTLPEEQAEIHVQGNVLPVCIKLDLCTCSSMAVRIVLRVSPNFLCQLIVHFHTHDETKSIITVATFLVIIP